jgi:hypothetical protein
MPKLSYAQEVAALAETLAALRSRADVMPAALSPPPLATVDPAGEVKYGTTMSRRKTKSEVARETLAVGSGLEEGNLLAQEARRQSLRVSRRRSEREALEFIEQSADPQGWK